MADEQVAEHYVVGIYEIATQITNYTVVPSNRDFAILMGNLNPNKYIVLVVTPLTNVVEFDDMLHIIRQNNRPDDMNYGKEEE